MNYVKEYWCWIEKNPDRVCNKVKAIYKQLVDDIDNPKEVEIYDPDLDMNVKHTFIFNEQRGNLPIEFIERFCKHSKGKWAGKPIKLELWQKAFIDGKECECEKGEFKFRNVSIDEHPALAEGERLPEAPDEQNDRIIRLQQEFFPVIDYHVHLKGGLTKEMAHEMSMQYGINYGVAPNAGEGGVGRMLADDAEVYDYFEEVKPLPFLCGVQGEGRKWTRTFSQEALGVFDYLFTDAMTIKDHKGRNARIYRPEEVHYDGITLDGYMEQIVDQTVKILSNEPADIYANPTFLPDALNAEYEKYWTDDRIDRVLDVLEKYNIALEINPRYRIPSFKIISMAKERGIKFTFGTNNVDADFGRLEYCIEAIDSCGIAASDIWFPSLSTRKDRPVILY